MLIRNIVKGRQSERWPTVAGEVVKAGATKWVGRRPIVRYRYRWNDMTYEGHRIAYTDLTIPSKEAMEAFLRQYPQGAAVDVRVNPRRPKDSVLRPGDRMKNWLEAIALIIFGLIFVLGS